MSVIPGTVLTLAKGLRCDHIHWSSVVIGATRLQLVAYNVLPALLRESTCEAGLMVGTCKVWITGGSTAVPSETCVTEDASETDGAEQCAVEVQCVVEHQR